MKVGWLADKSLLNGGAEMVSAELMALAPAGVEIITPQIGLADLMEVDAFVIHNCTSFDMSIIPELARKPVIKVVHDTWEYGDPHLRQWLLAHAHTLVFSCPAHAERFKFDTSYMIIPPHVPTEPFTAVSHIERTGGYVWTGRMHPTKGMDAVCRWARHKGVKVDFWGAGNGEEVITPPCEYKGGYVYEDLPNILSQYETFVFLPSAFEPFSRSTIEAWLSGCKLLINENVGAAYWLQHDQDRLFTAADEFWKLVMSV